MAQFFSVRVGMLLGLAAMVSCINAASDENCPAEGCYEDSTFVQLKSGARRADQVDDDLEHPADNDDLSGPTPCPPSPPPLTCELAQPQAPRDVTPGYKGDMEAVTPLDGFQTPKIFQTNLHWHLGAEHKSDGEFDQEPPAPDCLVPSGERAGYWCSNKGIDEAKLKSYDFKYCKDVEVGYTYEFHWVFSSGAPFPTQVCNGVRCWIDKKLQGYLPARLADEHTEGIPGLTDGLGGAFNRTNNPHVIVRGQVYRIVNDPSLPIDDKFLFQWKQPAPGNVTRYMGSTTGTGYNNTICSPLEVSWQVDQKCHTLSAQSLDNTCKMMQELYNMSSDLHPHGSRELVLSKYAAKESFPLWETQPNGYGR